MCIVEGKYEAKNYGCVHCSIDPSSPLDIQNKPNGPLFRLIIDSEKLSNEFQAHSFSNFRCVTKSCSYPVFYPNWSNRFKWVRFDILNLMQQTQTHIRILSRNSPKLVGNFLMIGWTSLEFCFEKKSSQSQTSCRFNCFNFEAQQEFSNEFVFDLNVSFTLRGLQLTGNEWF